MGEDTEDTVDKITSEQFSVAKGLLSDLLISMIDIPFFSEGFAPLYGGKIPVHPFAYTHDAAFNRQDRFLESLGKRVYENSRMVAMVEDNLSVLRSAEHSAREMHRNVSKYMGVQEILIRNLAGFISIEDEIIPVPYEDFDLLDKIAHKIGILQAPNKRVTTTKLHDDWMLDRRVIECMNRLYDFTCRIEEHGDDAIAQYETYNMRVKESIPSFKEEWRSRLEGLDMKTLAEYYPSYFISGEGVREIHAKKDGIDRMMEDFLDGKGFVKDPYAAESVPTMDISRAKRFLGRMIELKYAFEGQFKVNDDSRCIFSKDYATPEHKVVDNVIDLLGKKCASNE